MEQVSFYDYFPKQNDPLYLVLSKIPKGGTINLGEFEITLNKFGIYEIISENIHEARDCLDKCYEFLNSIGKTKDIFY